MLNNVILVGRVVDDPVLRSLDNGTKVCNVTIAVERPFRSTETNEYETDFITVTVWRGFAEAVSQYCKKGSTIGIKGRIQTRTNVVADINVKMLEVIAERVSFINLKNRLEPTTEE